MLGAAALAVGGVEVRARTAAPCSRAATVVMEPAKRRAAPSNEEGRELGLEVGVGGTVREGGAPGGGKRGDGGTDDDRTDDGRAADGGGEVGTGGRSLSVRRGRFGGDGGMGMGIGASKGEAGRGVILGDSLPALECPDEDAAERGRTRRPAGPVRGPSVLVPRALPSGDTGERGERGEAGEMGPRESA